MFSNCKSLSYLNLSNFNMDIIEDIHLIFEGCTNLEYINLFNSNPNISNLKMSENIFQGTSKNLVICTGSNIISQKAVQSICTIISCSNNWREDQKKITINSNQCYDNCNQTNNKYDYLSKCYGTCPNSTYYCKECGGPFNDTNSNCTSCISPNKYLENGNCIITQEINKDKYINIRSLYNTTNNTLIYNIIKEDILPSYDPENDFEIISEAADDTIFQITTSKNQLKALMNSSLNDYNLSILDISNCETILTEKYNLNENDDLILLKKEKQSNKESEKEVQLEIYEPYNKTKLNLSLCEKTKINIYVKAELSDETKYSYEKLKRLGYDMFNINDPFYQDI